MTTNPSDLKERLREEADLCRAEGADDIAALLDEAADALERKDEALREAEEALDAAARTINGNDAAVDAVRIVRGKVAIRAALQGDRE